MSLSPFQMYGFGKGVQTSIVQRAIVPCLDTVAAGSYAGDATYGSGKPELNTYSSVVVAGSSSSAIRQHDNEVDFDVQVALDLTKAAPFVAVGGQLRVLPLPPTVTTPPAWAQALPVADVSYGLPLFSDVEVVLSNTGAPALAGVVVGILQARLLYGGHLALVAFNPATGVTTAITDTDISGLFGSVVVGQQLLIKVRGTYRGQSSPY